MIKNKTDIGLFYIAASMPDRTYAESAAQLLIQQGYQVCSTWHSRTLENEQHWTKKKIAEEDLYDLNKAKNLIIISGEIETAGKHFEYGYAYAKGYNIFVYGYRQGVFQHLDNIFQFAYFDELFQHLASK